MEQKNRNIDKKNIAMLLGFSLLIMAFMFFMLGGNTGYINKPFGQCYENFTEDYGAFKSCGSLMSEDTAFIGIWSIFLGLLLLAFIVLPLLLKIKRAKQKGGLNSSQD